MVAITLLAFGVATLNQYWEREIDVLDGRERRRGRCRRERSRRPRHLVFGIVQCVTAEIYLLALVNALTAFLGLLVIVGYVLVYTPLKTQNVALDRDRSYSRSDAAADGLDRGGE